MTQLVGRPGWWRLSRRPSRRPRERARATRRDGRRGAGIAGPHRRQTTRAHETWSGRGLTGAGHQEGGPSRRLTPGASSFPPSESWSPMKAETFRVSSSDRCSHRARRWRGAIARRGTASRGALRRGRDRRRSRPRHDVAVVLDDHLLRDWMASSDTALAKAINGDQVATTNLWYARLCKSAARASSGALLEGWAVEERRALIAGLVSLPDDVVVVPMRQLRLRMGELSSDHHGLSALGAEAVAAAIDTQGRLLVSARHDGPGIRQCCETLGIGYDAVSR